MTQAQLADVLAIKLFGITRSDAWTRAICIDCKRWVNPLLIGDKTFDDPVVLRRVKEWCLSALCPECWAKTIGPELDD